MSSLWSITLWSFFLLFSFTTVNGEDAKATDQFISILQKKETPQTRCADSYENFKTSVGEYRDKAKEAKEEVEKKIKEKTEELEQAQSDLNDIYEGLNELNKSHNELMLGIDDDVQKLRKTQQESMNKLQDEQKKALERRLNLLQETEALEAQIQLEIQKTTIQERQAVRQHDETCYNQALKYVSDLRLAQMSLYKSGKLVIKSGLFDKREPNSVLTDRGFNRKRLDFVKSCKAEQNHKEQKSLIQQSIKANRQQLHGKLNEIRKKRIALTMTEAQEKVTLNQQATQINMEIQQAVSSINKKKHAALADHQRQGFTFNQKTAQQLSKIQTLKAERTALSAKTKKAVKKQAKKRKSRRKSKKAKDEELDIETLSDEELNPVSIIKDASVQVVEFCECDCANPISPQFCSRPSAYLNKENKGVKKQCSRDIIAKNSPPPPKKPAPAVAKKKTPPKAKSGKKQPDRKGASTSKNVDFDKGPTINNYQFNGFATDIQNGGVSPQNNNKAGKAGQAQ